MINDSRDYRCYALYHGQAEPVWFDTVTEAATYISAENVGRDLSPVARIVITSLALLCFDGRDRYCGMILGGQRKMIGKMTWRLGEQRAE